MKFRIPAIAAAILACCSCISVSSQLGGSLIPLEQTYDIYSVSIPIEEIQLLKADSLDARSSTRIAIGAVRDADGYLTTRSCALALVPLFSTLDFGIDPRFNSFHFSAAADSVSVEENKQTDIIQNVRVYPLGEPLDHVSPFDCNQTVEHLPEIITDGTPVITGKDSLSFNFTEAYGRRFFELTKDDLKDIDSYLAKIPGIYIETDEPRGKGGRINLYNLQLSYDADSYLLNGNLAELSFNSIFDGVRKDTSYYFYFGATALYDSDSLLTNLTVGTLPEICFNLCGGDSRPAGPAGDYLYVEGSGGLKPVISASYLADILTREIVSRGGDPQTAFINSARIVMPFEFPEDYGTMFRYPDVVSPNVRIHYTDTTKGRNQPKVSYQVLTDYSDENEDKGEIDRFMLHYAPNFTYHMKEVITRMKNDPASIASGDYDIWFLPMANETTTSSSASSTSEMSDYYRYLAYQSYYNNMYGGYGGYGGYGYGGYGYGGYGYGNDYYSNYYSYMLAAAYANSNATTTTTTLQRDSNRYYLARLNGPASDRHPCLKVTFSIPKN